MHSPKPRNEISQQSISFHKDPLQLTVVIFPLTSCTGFIQASVNCALIKCTIAQVHTCTIAHCTWCTALECTVQISQRSISFHKDPLELCCVISTSCTAFGQVWTDLGHCCVTSTSCTGFESTVVKRQFCTDLKL